MDNFNSISTTVKCFVKTAFIIVLFPDMDKPTELRSRPPLKILKANLESVIKIERIL